jgi:hypothetical protein
MPVFLLAQRNQTVEAAHPDQKVPARKSEVNDSLLRVGTAWREKDGSYLIQLAALPLSGQLLMRPPRPGETPQSTHQEKR